MSADLPFGEWHIIAAPRAPQRTLTPIGACMYCLRTEKLEDEHIIPDGCGGDLILPLASCRSCAEKINSWEEQVQKRYLGVTRAAAGVKSRKRRGRKPEDKRLFRAVAAKVPEGQDPHEDRGPEITDPSGLPKMVLAEITMGRPELLGGEIPGNGICLATSWLKDHGPEECTVDFWARGGDYLRLMAKIAHGLAVATMGINAFSPLLTDIILAHDHKPEDFWKYVGGQIHNARPDYLHRVRLKGVHGFIRSGNGLGTTPTPLVVAEIQLFANYSAPLYEVVVGIPSRKPKVAVEQ